METLFLAGYDEVKYPIYCIDTTEKAARKSVKTAWRKYCRENGINYIFVPDCDIWVIPMKIGKAEIK